MPYEDFQARIMPPWLSEGLAEAYNRSLGRSKDALVTRAVEAIRVSAIEYADAVALFYIGEERLIPKFKQETTESHRQRLQNAWDFWKWAGTVHGIELAFEPAGYDVDVIEHFRHSPDIWAEFTLLLKPNNQAPITDRWDDGTQWDDGTRWNIELGAFEPNKVRGILRRAKAAHSIPRNIYYFYEELDYWGDGDSWDDGTLWNQASHFRIL